MSLGLSRGTWRPVLKPCRRCCGVRVFGIGCANDCCFDFKPEAKLWAERPSHSSLLDVTVRTDTDRRLSVGVSRGSKGGCITPIRCDICGLPIGRCRCIVGLDYL